MNDQTEARRGIDKLRQAMHESCALPDVQASAAAETLLQEARRYLRDYADALQGTLDSLPPIARAGVIDRLSHVLAWLHVMEASPRIGRPPGPNDPGGVREPSAAERAAMGF